MAWADEARIVKRTSNLLEGDLSLLAKLHSRCSTVETSALVYVEKFIYRHEHPSDAGVYDLISQIPESEGIF